MVCVTTRDVYLLLEALDLSQALSSLSSQIAFVLQVTLGVPDLPELSGALVGCETRSELRQWTAWLVPVPLKVPDTSGCSLDQWMVVEHTGCNAQAQAHTHTHSS